MSIQRCWMCWRELGKKQGVYTWETVQRPGSGHLKVHKACKPGALKFLMARETLPTPAPNLGAGCSWTRPKLPHE